MPEPDVDLPFVLSVPTELTSSITEGLPSVGGPPLTALVGSSRAWVLEALVGATLNTTELAQRVGLAPATGQ